MFQPIIPEELVREIMAHIKMARKLARRKGLKILPAGLHQRLADKFSVSKRAIQHLITGDRRRAIIGKPPKRRGSRKRPRSTGHPLPSG